MNPQKNIARHTFILRCWAEKKPNDHTLIWRFALEDVTSREQIIFESMEKLLAHLQNRFADALLLKDPYPC